MNGPTSRPSARLHSVLSFHGGGGGGGDANNIVNRRRLARTHAKDIPFPCARINLDIAPKRYTPIPRRISFPLDLPDIELVWRLKSVLDFDRSRTSRSFLRSGSSQYCAFVLSCLLSKSAL